MDRSDRYPTEAGAYADMLDPLDAVRLLQRRVGRESLPAVTSIIYVDARSLGRLARLRLALAILLTPITVALFGRSIRVRTR